MGAALGQHHHPHIGVGLAILPRAGVPELVRILGVSGTSTSNPSIARTRQSRSHDPRHGLRCATATGPATGSATGSATRSNTSRITSRPNRFRARLIPPAVGLDQAASQQPQSDNDPVTLVATSS